MVNIVVVTRAALLIAWRASTWTVDKHLGGQSPDCFAVDPRDPTRVYCGTAGVGLIQSTTAAGLGNRSDRASSTWADDRPRA